VLQPSLIGRNYKCMIFHPNKSPMQNPFSLDGTTNT
jgi:hypothetical protein